MNSVDNDGSGDSAITAANSSGVASGGHDLDAYFLKQARLGSFAADEAEEEEEFPDELNTLNSSGGFVVVSTDKRSVKYTGESLHGHDVGAVQANRPAPVKRMLYYFEMFVKNAGEKGQVSIGFSNERFKMRRQPGWEFSSVGYHGDDGLFYGGDGKGQPCGPKYTTGDVVGAGINYAAQIVFFTKNGDLLGAADNNIKVPWFPTVAVHSQNEEVYVNLGQQGFQFDLKAYEVHERLRQQQFTIETTFLPNESDRIIRSYLLHYGYEDTLKALYMPSESTIPPISMDKVNEFDEEDLLYALSQRKTLCQLIRCGEIDAAFNMLNQWYPQIVQDDKSATCFLLHCQKFIEFVRVGKLEEAVNYGRVDLHKYFSLPRFVELVQDCVALLAYEQPMKCFVGYLLKDSQREVVADTVNAMILTTNPKVKDPQGCLNSCLEKLLRQLTVCSLEKRSLTGGQGETFNLHRVIATDSCLYAGIY